MRRRSFATVLFVLSAAAAPFAQTAAPRSPEPQPEAPKRVRAVRIPNGAIVVDGRLAESEWQLASPATDFVQQQPRENVPATEESEVRFLYDDDNLYVGGTFYEDEMDKLLVNELRRDFSPLDGDLIVVNLDTFNDRLNAYNFQTNPACAIRDSQSYDDGRSINPNFDAAWTCRSSRGERAWYFEEAIPFKQLRFPRSEQQTWGLNIRRLIRHKNENTYWSHIPRQFSPAKTTYSGYLDGIENVRPGRNIRVKPFVTGDVTRRSGVNRSSGDGGIDVKIGLGTNLVLDGTYRTDFSQVEVDAQQVNLTRFSLFFPEKREFFLENQGALQIGGFAQSNNNLVPFFSRTIGLSDTGTPIPIVGGLRLTGKVGRNTVGVLNMQTEEEQRPGAAPLPAANFTVTRYSREFLASSSAGAFFMSKERGDVSNRLVGGELRLNPMRSMNIDALLMLSEKTGFDDGSAWRSGLQYDPGLTSYNVSYTVLGQSFKDDLGFIPREGVNILSASVLRRIRPQLTSRFVREFRASLPVTRFTKDEFGVETATVTPTFAAELSDASSITANLQYNEELVSVPFRPQGLPPGRAIATGRHTFNTGEFSYNGSNSRRIAPVASMRVGGFYGGERRGFTAGMRVRYNEHLAATINASRDDIDVTGVAFDTNLVSLRVDSSFSTRMFLNAFIQYNSVTRQVISNVRYDFIHHPLSNLFVVFNETRPTAGSVAPPSRALVVKLTQLFSF